MAKGKGNSEARGAAQKSKATKSKKAVDRQRRKTERRVPSEESKGLARFEGEHNWREKEGGGRTAEGISQ